MPKLHSLKDRLPGMGVHLWGYARLSGNPMMNLIHDDLEVNGTNN